ncbi:MAG: Asp-tRNA(Asn)/Glu-tRNA(Gln) amidotransferase subunit GatC [Alphaproteobacteria bacterium]|nr:Asp-tRNA(Asn)/Glu-tRNA(Gln) amidotransferase subunit GatC [Alphaproteobacteria bacterium]
MALDKATVTKIARLARLRVAETEKDGLAGELSNILSFIEQLDEVDTKGVEPMTSVVAVPLRRRTDEVTDGGKPEDILANAPEATAGFFTIPKVIE